MTSHLCRGSPTRLGYVAWAAVAAALAFGALGERPESLHDHAVGAPATITIDAGTLDGRVVPIWDEVNLWKLYGRFGVHLPAPPPATWLRDALPWARYGRAVAALGGNHAPAIAPWCDHGRAAPAHPYTRSSDCGQDGTPGAAAQNELVRTVDGERHVDYRPFRVAVERLLASGVLPHLNLSAAPAAFTAPASDFSHYHWNAAPVRDHEGWLGFVDGAFASVADLGTDTWRLSVMNEANCLTLVGWEQHVRHVGYAGSPEDYARTLVATVARIREVAPGAHFHLGNYVSSDTFPGEDNLAEYLGALGAALGAHPSLDWQDFDALSLSLYETPDTTVYEFVSGRLARAVAAARTAGAPALPFKIDELGIHSVLVDAFETDWGRPIHPSLWAASWHAEALRVLLDAGTVRSVTPWLDRLVESWGTRRRYPKAHVYELFGMLSGQLQARPAPDGTLRFAPTHRSDGLPRLAVSGTRVFPPHAPHVRSVPAGTLSALATATDDGLRALVIHHRNRPVHDGHPTRRRHAVRLRLGATRLEAGAYAVRRLAVGGRDGAAWNDGTPHPLRWQHAGCRHVHDGALGLVTDAWIEANSVWLVEARRMASCPTP